ncbi:RusA family crossover junction endodeoxyribonuclease [Apilactobacillus micheneri]|uniref:RusA family crossover junction endodeoxyribonuclease n=1 Tax=Apilactobacillus micheneri TaxID=1899430 RepID=UPI000D02501F|nr:RusA family crossover junction endodeoxyribonuclease [Apilactobacillus micheneri]
MINLTLPIAPVAAGRPRFNRNGHAYDPKKSKVFKRQVESMLKFMYREKPISGKPIEVYVAFYREIQSSISKKEHARRANHEHMPIHKPDTDNYIKSILDAMNGILWTDDNLIVHIDAYKYYDDNPRIEINVKEWIK